MLEKPPILQGNTNDQVRALRDYLMRLAGTLDGSLQEATTGKNVTVTVDKQGRQVAKVDSDAVGARTEQEIRKSADELRSLIIKSADQVYEQMDTDKKEYQGTYLAIADFNTFEQNLDRRIVEDANGVIESYSLVENVRQLTEDGRVMQQYLTDLNGEIRRGIIWDPSENQYVIGIAISQSLGLTGQTTVVDEVTYYYLSDGQTFGLYTATGWQFWLNGQKVAWLNSKTNNLHVKDINIEGKITVGKAIIEANSRFDIRPMEDGVTQ